MRRKGILVLTLVLLVAVVTGLTAPASVTITQDGFLSVGTNVALAVNRVVNEPTSTTRYSGITTVTEEPWGYLYTLENGDIVEVGDSTTTDFKAHVKTIRWNGVADFSLWLEGGTFVPTLTDTTVSFNFNSNISVQIYPVPPSERTPEGGIEYDITLYKKPAQSTITFNIDWNGITWTKILPLDEEYDQVACEEIWGIELAPFTITPTLITSTITSEVLLARPEYDVNSYEGQCTTNWHSNGGDLGGGVTYSKVSRSYLHIHRGQMTDDLGDTAWVEDINLDEVNKEVTFTLPKTWLKNAEYPVHQVCGLDPAYTEDIDSWDSSTYGSDNTWSDYDIFTNHDVPKGAVAEVIMSNQEPGVEANTGIRTDGSSVDRRVGLHEAEGGGVTTCRMFAVCHVTTGQIETYSQDISDANLFYLVSYWENVGFTELDELKTPTAGSWQETQLVASGTANRIVHFVIENLEQNVANLAGVRATDSGVNRYVLIHEPETGGNSYVDMLTKADSNYTVDLYRESGNPDVYIFAMGYFGEELDFVELFQSLSHDGTGWDVIDLTAYLDVDGRVTDWLLLHEAVISERYLGVRDGDDSTTNRYILEHEAEWTGADTHEYTGFGISAKSNSDGQVYLYYIPVGVHQKCYLMGYFKPTAVGTEISNTPNSNAFGILEVNIYSDTIINYFRITNIGTGAVDITVQATDLAGGDDTWDLSDTATPGENIYGLKAGLDDDDDLFDVIVKESVAYNELVNNLLESATQDWGLRIYMPTTVTNYDGQQMSATLTLVCSAH